MIKNKLIFSIAALSLSACQYYSDEMTFYYEDENATPEVTAAPTQKVTSKELVIPEELRTSSEQKVLQTSSEQKITYRASKDATTISTKESSHNIETQKTVTEGAPQPLLGNKKEKDVNVLPQTDKIPMTYGEAKSTESIEEIKETKTSTVQYNSDDITPKVYAIAATRATNKMLDDTQKLYQKQNSKPKLLVQKSHKVNQQLPDGFHYADKVIYDIIDGSQNFTMVSNLDEADYVLNVEVDAYPNKGIDTPIIEYKLILSDTDDNEIDSWTQDIRQLQNDDKSWW